MVLVGGTGSADTIVAPGVARSARSGDLLLTYGLGLLLALSGIVRILLGLRREGLCEPGKLVVAVGVATDEGYPLAAELDLIDPAVDPSTGTARFRATLPNPEGLLSPGMSARVRLTPSPE